MRGREVGRGTVQCPCLCLVCREQESVTAVGFSPSARALLCSCFSRTQDQRGDITLALEILYFHSFRSLNTYIVLEN